MNTIRKGLEALPGVESAAPDNQTGTVVVSFEDKQISMEAIAEKLSDMGYPLVGENGMLKKAKSYVSCMIGRVATA